MKKLLSPLTGALAVVVVILALGAYSPPKEWQRTSLQFMQTAVIVYAADASTTYVATAAEPGTSATAASWQAKRIATSGLATTITWADGDNKFDNVPGTGGTGLPGLSYQ